MPLNTLKKLDTPNFPEVEDHVLAIDAILEYLLVYKTITITTARRLLPNRKLDHRLLISTLFEENLIQTEERFAGQFTVMAISNNGVMVAKSGGYSSLVKKREQEAATVAKKESLEMRKLENEVILTSWQYWFFWAGSAVAIISMIIQLIQFLKNGA
jgi:hypothetical protein